MLYYDIKFVDSWVFFSYGANKAIGASKSNKKYNW